MSDELSGKLKRQIVYNLCLFLICETVRQNIELIILRSFLQTIIQWHQGLAQLVEQSTYYHKFKGSNQTALLGEKGKKMFY